MTARSALVLGATGLVGRCCLELLLEDHRYDTVHAIVRTALSRQHPKLQQHVTTSGEMGDLEIVSVRRIGQRAHYVETRSS